MSATAVTAPHAIRLGRRRYPVVLPRVTDPRLHLAAVIISLQVLGQTVLHFELSIAQILVSLLTCAVLEVAITFSRERIIMWPASAMLTGNGVAFILRVPGTEHGDWWSMNGAWIFAATAAVSLLSKYLIRYRGRHIFNPSNFGLVLCFLLLGSSRVEPLDFWWGPMSAWIALALAIIVAGGLLILSRLRMLSIAVAFWVTFAAFIGVLAASGHSMTARWHLGPISDLSFWWVLVTSPEILIFLFFMITDPKTAPLGKVARIIYAVGVALLATLLIAPQTTEFATKVAVLAALAIVCAFRPLLERWAPAPGSERDGLPSWAARLADLDRPKGQRAGAGWDLAGRGGLLLGGFGVFAGFLVIAGIPARSIGEEFSRVEPSHAMVRPKVPIAAADVPTVTIDTSEKIASRIDEKTARQMARDVVEDLTIQTEALKQLDPRLAATAAGRSWLEKLEHRIRTGEEAGRITVPTYDVEHMTVSIARRPLQAAPAVLATLDGTVRRAIYEGSLPERVSRVRRSRIDQTFEVAWSGHEYLLVSDEPPPGWEPPARAP